VFGEQENAAGIDADTFEDPVTIQQAVVKNTDNRLFSGNKSTCNVDQSGHGETQKCEYRGSRLWGRIQYAEGFDQFRVKNG
jgi:hypothetical protein